MRLLDSVGLVVEVSNLGDRDRIVTLITPEYGKVRAVAKGARTKYSRYAGQLHLLARLRCGWFEKESSDLARLREVHLERPATGLQNELEGLLLGTYLAEQATVFVQENEESPRLFRLLDSCLDALLNDRVDEALVGRYYEAWMLRLAGIFPHPSECPACGRDLDDLAVLLDGVDGLVCGDCARGQSGLRVGPGVLGFLRRISAQRVQDIAAANPPGSDLLERVEELTARVRREFLGEELRSYVVLKRTLAEVGRPSCAP
ncbi:MAG: DNA repair protein RecO [Acidobacteriota bacterium]